MRDDYGPSSALGFSWFIIKARSKEAIAVYIV